MTELSTFVPNDETTGLILATHLPGSAAELGDQRLDWGDLDQGTSGRPIWIHLNRTKERAQQWIREESGLEPIVVNMLLADETRPTFQPFGDGFLVILRGVNMNPGETPDELISVRMWIDPTRVISLRQHRFQTIVELRKRAQDGKAPATPGAFLAAIAQGLSMRMTPSVTNLEELIDDIEDTMLDSPDDDPSARSLLAKVRRQAISLRRYLVPQRDALRVLALHESPVLSRSDHSELRHATEIVARVVDALEEIRDRAAVTQDEIRARHEARVGRTLYLLTIVATVALPLGLLTGLLGINVGGVPLADSASGFAIICGLMLVLSVVEIVFLKWMRWI